MCFNAGDLVNHHPWPKSEHKVHRAFCRYVPLASYLCNHLVLLCNSHQFESRQQWLRADCGLLKKVQNASLLDPAQVPLPRPLRNAGFQLFTLSCRGNYAACALRHTRPVAGVAILMHACSPIAFWIGSGRNDGRACNGLELWGLVGFKARWCSCSLLGFSLPSFFRERCAYGLAVPQLRAAPLPASSGVFSDVYPWCLVFSLCTSAHVLNMHNLLIPL